MAHTFTSILLHCVFSTKNRENALTPETRERLWPYMGGIARENSMKALAVGGTDDHVHMLLSLPSTMSAAKALQLVKGGSSLWASKTLPAMGGFTWQEGYGAFSISTSHLGKTIAYIESQDAHHRKKSFEEEFIAILNKHRIRYDERFVLG